MLSGENHKQEPLQRLEVVNLCCLARAEEETQPQAIDDRIDENKTDKLDHSRIVF